MSLSSRHRSHSIASLDSLQLTYSLSPRLHAQMAHPSTLKFTSSKRFAKFPSSSLATNHETDPPFSFDVQSEQLGMDNSSISIKGEKGSYRVDVPMRSINGGEFFEVSAPFEPVQTRRLITNVSWSGSHGRVKKLYDYLRVPLEKNEFSYSFSRLDRSSPAQSDPSDSPTPSSSSTAFDSRASTPLPPYSSEESTSTNLSQRRRTTSESPNRSPPLPSSPSLTTTRTTTLLYEGSSGLKWPPVSLPSSLSTSTSSLPALLRSTWSQAHYIVHLLFLAISYLHLLLLSFFYVNTGLTQNRRTLRLPLLLKLNNVGKEPLELWCDRHGVFRAMKEEVLIPLMAAVCTVGIEEARTMPVGEALGELLLPSLRL